MTNYEQVTMNALQRGIHLNTCTSSQSRKQDTGHFMKLVFRIPSFPSRFAQSNRISALHLFAVFFILPSTTLSGEQDCLPRGSKRSIRKQAEWTRDGTVSCTEKVSFRGGLTQIAASNVRHLPDPSFQRLRLN